jgi:hypothetical protein
MKSFFKKVAAGSIAGLAAAYAMRQFVSAWHCTGGQQPEDGAFGLDYEADINAATRFWRFLFEQDLSEAEALTLASLMHYGYSAAAGAGYAILASRYQGIRAGWGMAYGAVMWLAADELGVTLTGLSDPRSKTKASHGVALAAHLLFGSVTEISRRGFLLE